MEKQKTNILTTISSYKYFNIVVHLILSFLAVGAVNIYLFSDAHSDFYNGLVSVVMFVIIVYFGRNTVFNRKSKAEKDLLKIHRIALGAAIFTAVVFGIGTSMYNTDSLAPIIGTFGYFVRSIATTAGAVYLLFLVFKAVMTWFKDFSIKLPQKNEWRFFGGNWQSLLFWWAVIFLAWLPVWLAYFPGIFSFDANQTLWQATNFELLNNRVPILHTLFTAIPFRLGGNNQMGTILYSIMQMGLMSLLFSYVVYYLAKLKIHYGVRVIAVLWFALSPLNAIFSFIQNQDALLGAFLTVCLVILLDFVMDPQKFLASKSKVISLVVFLIIFALFRRNAVYALVVAGVLMPLIICKKPADYNKKVYGLFLGTAFIAWLFMSPVTSMMGWDVNLPREALPVPAQQIARVVTDHWEYMDPEEQALVQQVLPVDIRASYNPRWADPIKDVITADNVSYFWQLWFRLLPQYPVEFTEAFITLNLPLWFPDAAYPDRHSHRVYIEDWVWGGFEIYRESKIPWLLPHYESFARNQSVLQQLPVLRTITSIGTPIWVLFAVTLLLLAKKKGTYAVILLLPFALWLTFIVGPVSNVRYMYPLFASYPVLIAIVAAVFVKGIEKGKK